MEWKIIHIDETNSTNCWLKDVCSKESGSKGELAQSANEKTPKLLNSLEDIIVVADYQTAGRGCGTNTWESERGKNLLFSLLIHPTDIYANEQFRITEAVSVALCQTLQSYLTQRVEIKWPNDIYVGDRKICGILIENRLHGSMIKNCIIGIGLNVNQREFKSDAPNPVSLYQLTGKETDLEVLFKAFLAAFDEAFNSKTTCFAYRERLYRRLKYGTYATKTSCFEARLMDVLPDGRLLLEDKNGLERLYAFKEIQFII